MHDDKFMRSTEFGKLRPNALQENEQVTQAYVADAQMNHFGWRIRQHDPIREVGILADDNQVMFLCVLPDCGIGHVVAQVINMEVVFAMPQRKTVGQIRID